MLRICAAGIPPQHGSKRKPHLLWDFPEPAAQKADFPDARPASPKIPLENLSRGQTYLIILSALLTVQDTSATSLPGDRQGSAYTLTNRALTTPRGSQLPF